MRVAGAALAALLALPVGPAKGAAVDKDTHEGGAAFVPDVFSFQGGHRAQVDLNGEWEFRRDKENGGRNLGWHRGEGEFAQRVRIPGVPQAQGIGEPHHKVKTWFLEPFWVRRTFPMPTVKPDERVWLRLGGILPAAEVYLNGEYVGYTKSSRTQQKVDVTPWAKPGEENRIAIKVCDPPEVRLDGLWEMAEAYGFWNGVYRPVAIEIAHRTSVADLYVDPDIHTGTVSVQATLTEAPREPLDLVLKVRDGRRLMAETRVPADSPELAASLKLRKYTLWSPETPKLYALEVSLVPRGGRKPLDRVGLQFGMRSIRTDASRFYLNDQPLYVRCFGDDQLYPETLAPPADKAWYLERLKRARAYGFRAVKSCVEILPQEYIEAADEAGMLIIQEMPFGLSGLRANRETIDARFRDYFRQETEGLIRDSRNHASVIAYSMTSEMGIGTQESFDFFCRELPLLSKKLAPHALAIDCTGFVETEETQRGKRVTDFYATVMPAWMKEVLDETAVRSDGKHPTILHEYNWWSCYPDPQDRPKWEPTQFHPFWLDTLVRLARENGQEELIPTYGRNSLWLQALCRKDGVEYARRNPIVQGFILWLLIDLHQYCECLLDDFWMPKNVSAEEFLQSNGDTVILLAEEGNRCYPMGSTVRIPLAVSHYGEKPLGRCMLRWKLIGAGAPQSGTLPAPELPQGSLTRVGDAVVHLPAAGPAAKLDLQVALYEGRRVRVEREMRVNTNQWSFWMLPEAPEEVRRAAEPASAGKAISGGAILRLGEAHSAPIPEGTPLVVADAVDPALADYLERGGRCLLFAKDVAIENPHLYYPGMPNFHKSFRTIPWNSGPGNLGTVIVPHPALEGFPHEGMCDLQFLWMVRDIIPMEFSALRQHGVAPIIRGIDWYLTHRNNAYLLEFRVGQGSVLATTLNVLPRLGEKLEARALLQTFLRYGQGPAFAPTATVPRDEFLKLFGPKPPADKPAQ